MTGSSGRFAVVVGAASDRGQVRPVNEDSFVAATSPAVAVGLDAVLAVADGMGGHQAGEVASGLVRDAIRQQLGAGGPNDPLRARTDLPGLLSRIIQTANQEVRSAAMADINRHGMGTTITVGAIADGAIYLAHVGDSRAYLARQAGLIQLSNDHNWVAEQVRAGLLAPDAAASHPRKNVLTRAVGSGVTVDVDSDAIELDIGDRLLLCSDGLSNLLTDQEIYDVIRSYGQPQAAAERLVALANARGAPDNVTAVVARIVDVSERERGDAVTQELRRPVAAGRQRRSVRQAVFLIVVASILLGVIAVILYLIVAPLVVAAVNGIAQTVLHLLGRAD